MTSDEAPQLSLQLSRLFTVNKNFSQSIPGQCEGQLMVQQSNLDASMMLSLTDVMVPVAFIWFQQKKSAKSLHLVDLCCSLVSASLVIPIFWHRLSIGQTPARVELVLVYIT